MQRVQVQKLKTSTIHDNYHDQWQRQWRQQQQQRRMQRRRQRQRQGPRAQPSPQHEEGGREREREMAREELSRTSSSFSRTSVSRTSTSDLPQLNLDFSPTSVVPRLQSYHSLLLASCSSLCLFVLLACLFRRSPLCPRHHQPRVNGAPAILHQPRVNLVPPPSFNTSRHVRREEGSRRKRAREEDGHDLRAN